MREAVVEEMDEPASISHVVVSNNSGSPLLIPEGQILVGAKQNRIINVTVLVAGGVKCALPVSGVEQGRWRYASPYFELRYYAPPSLRYKKLKSIQSNRSESGAAASNQSEVWQEVQHCIDRVKAWSETISLTDACESVRERLNQRRKHLALPETTAGILVGRRDRIVGMDLFDSPTTFKTLWGRLADAYLFEGLRGPGDAPATPSALAQRFIERLGNVARARVPALALGDELEIVDEGLAGTALLYDSRLCQLAVFGNEE